jgi:CRP-like cAMP-binding protein
MLILPIRLGEDIARCGLTAQGARIMASHWEVSKFQKNELVLQKGQLSAYICIVLHGKVNRMENGKCKQVHGPGDVVGEKAFIASYRNDKVRRCLPSLAK